MDIKHKAKRLDNGEWVYGYYAYDNFRKCHVILRQFIGITDALLEKLKYAFDIIPIDPSTVCVYTGLNNSEGNEIYEGDRLLIIDYENMEENESVVEYQVSKYDYPAFELLPGHDYNRGQNGLKMVIIGSFDVKVIGSIHD